MLAPLKFQKFQSFSLLTTLIAKVVFLLMPTVIVVAAPKRTVHSTSGIIQAKLSNIERDLDGRLGVFVLDTANGATLTYRANERFPFCSTFKVLVAGAILHKSEQEKGLLPRRVYYKSTQLVEHSPITQNYVKEGLTVAQLCAAALQYSDNTAANLLMQILGGPSAINAYARSINDNHFRLDRWETALNTAIPADTRDTSSPMAMGQSLQRLVVGSSLKNEKRNQLRIWMLGNTTGESRIKAGIPKTWKIADKTGSGSYGTANDIAVLWPPKRSPIIIVIYTTRHQKTAQYRNDILAATAEVIIDWYKSK